MREKVTERGREGGGGGERERKRERERGGGGSMINWLKKIQISHNEYEVDTYFISLPNKEV